jgi:hypothetical protein
MWQEASPGQTCMLGRLNRVVVALRQFLYGMTTYEMVRDLKRRQAHLESRLAILAVGGLLGVPLPTNYYGLRLLPHLLPDLERERRRLLRERDLTDLARHLG